MSRLLFASLVTVHPKTLAIVNDLAEVVTVESPTRVVATLRGDARFSDGTNITSTDVIATMRSCGDPRVAPRFAPTYSRIRHMEARDERTVVFDLDAPRATFLSDLEMPILPARMAARAHSIPDVIRAGVFSGSYRAVATDGQSYDLRENRYAHRRARLPALRVLVVRDDNTRALRLIGGAADLAIDNVPALLVPRLATEPRLAVASVPSAGTTYLGFNLEHPILRDVRVRHAIAYAIDRDSIIRGKFGGRATAATSLIPEGHWAKHRTLVTDGFDPGRAREELDAAGYAPDANGVRLRVVLRTSTDRFRQGLARAIANMLADVGIAAEVRTTEFAVLLDDLNRGKFELATLQLPELFDPHVLSIFFASHRIPGPGREGSNRWRFRNAEMDALLAVGESEMDRSRRTEIYGRVQEIMARELPVIPLWHEHVVVVGTRQLIALGAPRHGRFSLLSEW